LCYGWTGTGGTLGCAFSVKPATGTGGMAGSVTNGSSTAGS